MSEAEQYQYTLINKQHNSLAYGVCEVCGTPVSTVYHQTERRQYTRNDGSTGWTHDGCSDTFGHLQCLMDIRRNKADTNHQHAA